jgi:uncharacterized damage-inducible protein DinB
MLSNTSEDVMKRSCCIPTLLLFAAAAFAQSKDPISSALREGMPGRQKNIVAAVDAMPADKFSYKPTPDQMTYGHLVAHIIEANYILCSAASAVPAPKVEEAKESDSKDKLLAATKASFDFCGEALAKMDDSKLGETTEAFGQKFTRARMALGLAGSWSDHYGAQAMYLRLNGIIPPSAKK